MKKVISGETAGISKSVNWQGGGFFVYCELAKLNQRYVDAIMSAETDDELKELLTCILKSGFISHKVKINDINKNTADVDALSLSDKKRFLLELLDANQLYVNLCDMDDESYDISDADKVFTRSFYGVSNDSLSV